MRSFIVDPSKARLVFSDPFQDAVSVLGLVQDAVSILGPVQDADSVLGPVQDAVSIIKLLAMSS